MVSAEFLGYQETTKGDSIPLFNVGRFTHCLKTLIERQIPIAIPLTQGKVALIDAEDFERVNKCNWCAVPGINTFYAKTNLIIGEKRSSVRMHRLIMNAKKGQEIDHQNSNGLDNRKQYLRFANHKQNHQNSFPHKIGKSKLKGVCWHKTTNRWRAKIKIGKRQLHLGTFKDEYQAALAYDGAAIKHFKEFAKPNILPNPYVLNDGSDRSEIPSYPTTA